MTERSQRLPPRSESGALFLAVELRRVNRRLHEELKAVGENPRLAALTAQAVGKALRILAEKVEYMSTAGGASA